MHLQHIHYILTSLTFIAPKSVSCTIFSQSTHVAWSTNLNIDQMKIYHNTKEFERIEKKHKGKSYKLILKKKNENNMAVFFFWKVVACFYRKTSRYRTFYVANLQYFIAAFIYNVYTTVASYHIIITNSIRDGNLPRLVLYELRRPRVWLALWQGDIPLLSSGESGIERERILLLFFY